MYTLTTRPALFRMKPTNPLQHKQWSLKILSFPHGTEKAQKASTSQNVKLLMVREDPAPYLKSEKSAQQPNIEERLIVLEKN